ncbi:MAG: metallopeptidase TldD-related protein [Sulfolobaceae archaeon]|jgi:hypothetical protein|nr:metallopeptidase TldD-related protein [Sulfolobaceae archaeon]
MTSDRVYIVLQRVKNRYEITRLEMNEKGYVTYTYSYEYQFTRSLIKGKWVMGESSGEEPSKEFEVCSSFTHPSFNDSVQLEVDFNMSLSITVKKVVRQIDECVEMKVINYVSVNGEKYVYTGSPKSIKDVMQFLKGQEVNQRVTKSYEIGGRQTVILSPEVFAKVLHYFVIHFLNGDTPHFKIGDKVLGEITIYDDPLYQFSPAFSTFDDEGVKTKKKELIGDGYVTSYLGTLTTRFGETGNARGDLPKPDYFTLSVKSGDWKLSELMEESKKDAFLVKGVKADEIVGNSVRITPKSVIKLNQGGVYVREVAIPLQELLTIDAITKDVMSVYVDDEHGAYLPFVRMKARLILY